jgi:hypothetical protein
VFGANAQNLTVSEYYVSIGGTYGPEPQDMAAAGMGGALVITGLTYYTDTGVNPGGLTKKLATGGHVLAMTGMSGQLGAATATMRVNDPATQWVADTVQSPYSADPLQLAKETAQFGYKDDTGEHYAKATLPKASGWALDQNKPGIGFYVNGYTTIQTKKVVTAFPRLIQELSPVQIPGGPPPVEGARLRGRPVVDLALAPEGVEQPFLRRGSRAIWTFNTVTRAVHQLGTGPARAHALTYGGPAETLFVAGARQIAAFNRAGRKLASASPGGPVQALAFDDHGGHLVALSGRRLLLFDSQLHARGSFAVPAAALAGKGRVRIAVSPAGVVDLKRDGSGFVAQGSLATGKARIAAAGRATPLRMQIRQLQGAATARGLTVDDSGEIFVSQGGKLLEFLPSGKPVERSPFAGLRAGPNLAVTRSFSNVPAGHRLPVPIDSDPGVPPATP